MNEASMSNVSGRTETGGRQSGLRKARALTHSDMTFALPARGTSHRPWLALVDMMNQVFPTRDRLGKGSQMPVCIPAKAGDFLYRRQLCHALPTGCGWAMASAPVFAQKSQPLTRPRGSQGGCPMKPKTPRVAVAGRDETKPAHPLRCALPTSQIAALVSTPPGPGWTAKDSALTDYCHGSAGRRMLDNGAVLKPKGMRIVNSNHYRLCVFRARRA